MIRKQGSLIAATALLALVACGPSKTDRQLRTTSAGGTTVTPAGTDAARRGTTLIRFVNALPRPGRVSLASDQRVVFHDVSYKQVTEFTEIDPNVTRLTLRLAGSDSGVAENREIVGDGAHYTVVAWPDEQGRPRIKVLRDELGADSAKARVRFIQAVPDLDQVQVLVQGASEPLFGGVDAGHEAGFKDVNPTHSPLVIRKDAESGPLLTVSRMPLDAGRAYTVVLTRNAQHRLEAVVFEDQLTGAERR